MVFKHVLLPTDGSALSELAILQGVRLAKESQAKVTGVTVTPEFRATPPGPSALREARDVYLDASHARARRHLAMLQTAAADEGVICDTVIESSDHPYEAIISTAESKGCDLILMASHGRRGFQRILRGSQTEKVLMHCRIPVLVYR